METGKMINRISNRLRRRSKKAQETLGITGAKGNILDYILVESEKHNVYQKEIEKEFGLRPPTATEVLKNLEAEGLIVRVPDETDARYKKIVFTEKADKIRNVLRREIEESEALLLTGITEEEREIFMKITEKMLENLEKEEG
ncbi:MarR family transcriptional regulator [Lachnoclostridium sp. An169]|uniref:MarR family winged helix-turn-helix transcriptional regulator n=1 Tax=Lachnoclostridium sp. An169 TaxID=1965569 RepID=UPI000B3B00FD|nr:MarR family transcriptional regulator [Lachnoclostridium sp. An169]OUP80556.1 MarR family transcriptional regulator [Lachnoclostridium sp. An169]HJA64687.1 MarR family transcriptional regulator [Candidatus Mediterraneibacter cottocaccae]